jgi:preprotein translocase subunit SecD
MARPKYRPGRTLIVFFAAIGVLFGLVALAGSWKPALGLDLQGGQRITLRAKEANVKPEALAEAAKIINQRVNGTGVSEASVSTQGKSNIVVSIPGESNQALVDIVQRQARLGFRLIACSTATPGPCAAATAGTPVKASGPVEEALAWRTAPTQEWMTKFQQATCPPQGGAALLPGEKTASPNADAPGTPMVACSDSLGPDGKEGTTDDEPSSKYLLSAAPVEGKDLKNAVVGQNQNAIDFLVDLTFKASGASRFAKISEALYNNSREPFAIVLDGTVLSAPSMNDPNLSTRASITGNFNQQSATSLATSLKFGALPVAFEDNPKNDTIGPSLAGNQLSAGIWAGIVGLLLVMLYCALYYRGLGGVVIASLVVAGVMTYGLVLLLAKAGFTLSLPGIAGLIVAVGITADSFIVFFERIRDEMRDGKSMRVAVESGWTRARNTCLAADAVSLAAALVLYIFAIDDVRGFAFTLGLSTLVDLAVFFWFTKPLMSYLGRFTFFNHGHPLSGLSAATLGVDKITKGATS